MNTELKNRLPIRILSSLTLTTVGLIWLTFLVIWGTIYQSAGGLYAAQQKLFGAWFFLAAGFIPIPALLSTGAILLVNLLAALLFRVKWIWRNTGLILVHLGLLLFLAGGFYTNKVAQESFLTLAEGESSSFAQSYHEWELAVFKDEGASRRLNAVDTAGAGPGDQLKFPDFDLVIVVQKYHKNGTVDRPGGGTDQREGEKAELAVRGLPLSPEPAENIPAGIFAVQGDDKSEPLILSGRAQNTGHFSWRGQTVGISLRLRRFLLPVELTLLDFKKTFYPGSGIPKSFESRVEMKTPEFTRHALISMNRPLRYRDMTFYQSSYGETGGRETSTLSVVKNSGRWLPYISSALIFLGLLIHYFFVYFIRPRFRKTEG